MFGNMHHRNPFLFALPASVRRFQMPLKGLNFVETLVKFGIIQTTDSLYIFKVHLTPKFSFSLNRIYLLFEAFGRQTF